MAKTDRGLCWLLVAFTWAGNYHVNEPLNQSTFIYKGLITSLKALCTRIKPNGPSTKNTKDTVGRQLEEMMDGWMDVYRWKDGYELTLT